MVAASSGRCCGFVTKVLLLQGLEQSIESALVGRIPNDANESLGPTNTKLAKVRSLNFTEQWRLNHGIEFLGIVLLK